MRPGIGARPCRHAVWIAVAGRTGIATLKGAMVNMLEGNFISEHDYNIGCRIAETMCGGDVVQGAWWTNNGCSTWSVSTLWNCWRRTRPGAGGVHAEEWEAVEELKRF